MHNTTPTTLIGIAATAARFNVSTSTVARWLAAGAITKHHPPTDKRAVLIDPAEVAAVFGMADTGHLLDRVASRTTETITVAEAATLLNLAVTMDQPEVYHLLRGQLTEEFTGWVTMVLGGADRLAELDTAAGYSPVAEG